MKKLIPLLLSILLLNACAQNLSASSTNIQNSDSVETIQEDIETESKDKMIFSSGSLINGNQDGAYLVLTSSDFTSNLLYYVDYQTQQMVELCNQPNCNHSSDSCTAWISNPANVPELAVTENQLILIYPGNPYYIDKYGDEVLPKIQTRDLSGGTSKDIITFASNIELDNAYAIDQEHIYLLKEEVSRETIEMKKSLVSIDLKTGKEKIIISFDADSDETWFWVGVQENVFVFKKITVNTDSDNPEIRRLSQVHQLYTIDKEGHVSDPIMAWKHLKGLEGSVDKNFFLLEDGTLQHILSNDKSKVIKDERFNPIDTNILAYSSPYLVFSSSVYRDENYDAPIWYCVNMDNQDIQELTNVTSLGQDSQFKIRAQSDSFFVATFYEESSNSSMVVLIPKADFLTNQTNWKILEVFS